MRKSAWSKNVVSATEHWNVSPVLLSAPTVRGQRTAQGYNFAMTNSTKGVQQDSGKSLHRHGATYQWRWPLRLALSPKMSGIFSSRQQNCCNRLGTLPGRRTEVRKNKTYYRNMKIEDILTFQWNITLRNIRRSPHHGNLYQSFARSPP